MNQTRPLIHMAENLENIHYSVFQFSEKSEETEKHAFRGKHFLFSLNKSVFFSFLFFEKNSKMFAMSK